MSPPERDDSLRAPAERPAETRAVARPLSGAWIARLDDACATLAAPRPLRLLLIASFVVSSLYVTWVFEPGVLLGTSAFWRNPHGIIGRGWGDIFTNLSGYNYFQHDTWQLPLFHVTKLGAPDGTNIFFSDSIPWLALAGRLIFQVSGVSVNLYGIWIAFCYCASAMSLTALVATLGQRGLAAAAAATITGLCMPALLARWGHTALLAHFEVILALILYFRTCRSTRAWRVFLGAAGLALLTVWTNPYIFAMTGAITLAAIAQATSNRAIGLGTAMAILLGLAVLIIPVLLLSGLSQSPAGFTANGFGAYSMNVLSPIVPQRSGLIPRMRDFTIDATGGQYEGFSYLGGGILLLLVATSPYQLRLARRGLRHHPWLSALFALMTVFAFSNLIFVGNILIADVPLPAFGDQLASIFRASGRWFWPVMYCATAIAIVAPVRWYGVQGVLLLCLAIPLQWIDSAPLRQAVMASVRLTSGAPFDPDTWLAAMTRYRAVRVIPEFDCVRDQLDWNGRATVQLQYLASMTDRPINSVYARGHAFDCASDRKIDGPPPPGARSLFVFLNESSNFAHLQALARTGTTCRAGPRIVVCSDIPGETDTLALLARASEK